MNYGHLQPKLANPFQKVFYLLDSDPDNDEPVPAAEPGTHPPQAAARERSQVSFD